MTDKQSLLSRCRQSVSRYWRRFRYVIRDLSDSPYMVRYRLLSTPQLGIYLHHILRSDGDRELHDHPFDFTTWLLWGSYIEYEPDVIWKHGVPGAFRQVSKRRAWLSVIRHKAEDPHRLKLVEGRRVWTLFVRGPRVREWGFYLDNENWIDWKAYHELKARPELDLSNQEFVDWALARDYKDSNWLTAWEEWLDRDK